MDREFRDVCISNGNGDVTACHAKPVTSWKRVFGSSPALTSNPAALNGGTNGFHHDVTSAVTAECEQQSKLDDIEATADYLLSRTTHRPQIAIICGTGLGALSELMHDVDSFPYDEIPNFVPPTVKGHAGSLLFGTLRDKSVACMRGRIHAYEGHSMWQVTFPIRVLQSLGIRVLLVTNASGALNPEYDVGDVMIITDHINLPGLCGLNPLMGLSDDRWGPRFPVMSDAYDTELQELFRETAAEIGLRGVRDGVYVFQSGPVYETPAECRLFRLMGGDAAGMSTVPEVIVARHSHQPMRCLGLALITNKIQQHQQQKPVTTPAHNDEHDAVLVAAQLRTKELRLIVAEFIARIDI